MYIHLSIYILYIHNLHVSIITSLNFLGGGVVLAVLADNFMMSDQSPNEEPRQSFPSLPSLSRIPTTAVGQQLRSKPSLFKVSLTK